jgi:hypothetical protein
MKTNNIAILTTVINQELYKKSSCLFPSNMQRYVIDGTNKMHGLDSILYMMKKLKGKGIEWLIMADEDVLFIDTKGIYQTIDYMEANDYMVCGVRDGGQINIRYQNPYVINTFLSILNFRELEKIWNKKDMLKNQYSKENEFTDDLNALTQQYDAASLFEPYYCFYLWLRRKGKKILFLNASTAFEDDEITTVVLDANSNKMAYHTWYARSYGINQKHTERIDKVFKQITIPQATNEKITYFKDSFYVIKYTLNKNWIRVKMKLKSIIEIISNR